MTRLKLLKITLLSFLICSSATAQDKVSSSETSDSCPPVKEAKTLLNDKIIYQSKQLESLQNFIDGKFNTKFLLENLFEIDPADTDVVSKRLSDLKNDAWQPNIQILNCFVNEEKLASATNKLQSILENIRQLRIGFFELPVESRQVLLNSFKNFKEHSDQANQLEKEKDEAISKQKEAEKAIIIAENQAQDEKNADLKKLATARVNLEESKIKLSQFQSDWTEKLKLRQEFYTKASSLLGDLSAQLNSEIKLEKLELNYREVTDLWLDLSQRIYQFYDRQKILFKIPELPNSPTETLTSLKNTDEALQYLASLNEAIKTKTELAQSIQTRLNEENQQNFRLLLMAGQLRSQYISILRKNKNSTALMLSSKYITDLSNEIRIIPYRWMATFYSRIIDIRQQFNLGIQGYLSLAKNFGFLVLILGIVAAFWFSLKNLSRYLTQFKDKLLHQNSRSSMSRTLVIWIPRVNPYIPWTLSLIALEFMYDLLSNTFFAEFNIFLPYIEYYIIYRIFRELMTSCLFSFSFRAKITTSFALRKKIQSTTKTIGLFLFLLAIVLHTVGSIARKGLLYHHTVQFSWFFGFVMLIALVYQWRLEIAQAIRTALPKTGESLAVFCKRWWGIPFQLLSVFILIFIHVFEFLKEVTSEFKISKKISAQLFRRQIVKGTKKESLANEQDLPEDYQKWFDLGIPDDHSLLIEPHSEILRNTLDMIDDWKQDPSEEHTLAVYGDKGSGKSCFLEIIQDKVTDLKVIHDRVPPKLITSDDALNYVAKLLGITKKEGTNWFFEADNKMPKTIILLDECQNLFLGKVDGFEGFKTFVDLINLKTENIFWCMAFNRQSWNYLFDVFGRHEFYRSVQKLEAWEDEDIQKLVETRHKKSDFTLSFDQIISAASSTQDLETSHAHIEKKFFQLLWEQSGGNPRAAISLWLASLTPTSGKTLKVGLPREDNDFQFGSLLDNLHFIYAQLIRHENLTIEEAVEVSTLSQGIVSHAFKMGIEKGFLERSKDDRYRVTPNAQDKILKFLAAKNFIYGN